jgi:hypothetical protein
MRDPLTPEDFTTQHDNPQRVTEHGQDWMTCGACGATYSIVDAHHGGEELETIDYGDGTCHEKPQRPCDSPAIRY